LAGEAGRYRLHPALLDAALQVLAAALPANRVANEALRRQSGNAAQDEAWVPVRVARFRVASRSSAASRAAVTPASR